MKPNFKAGQGNRTSKGDKTPSSDWFSNKAKGRSVVVRKIYKQTVCTTEMSNALFDVVVTQWKSKEGVIYYTARKTEMQWLKDQYCHASVQVGPKIKVKPSTTNKNLWFYADSMSNTITEGVPDFG